ncbi:MAG: hypothetical protein ACFFD8_11305 [Candidatus Thorarchaeota archaeon]
MVVESERRGISETNRLLVVICFFLLIASIVLFTTLQKQWNLISELQEDLERSRFTAHKNYWRFYYTKPENQNFGIDGLEETLSAYNWSQPYRQFEFDCSEMSAYLEQYLENRGWNTSIAVGFSHAWLLVETNESDYTPVEATSLEIIYDDNENYDNYFRYEHLFKNIYSAHAFDATEFRWYTSYGYTDPEWVEYFTP